MLSYIFQGQVQTLLKWYKGFCKKESFNSRHETVSKKNTVGFPWQTLIHHWHPLECLFRIDYWVTRIYKRLRGAMEQTAIGRAVIDKQRPGSILSGHDYRVQPRSRFLWRAKLLPVDAMGAFNLWITSISKMLRDIRGFLTPIGKVSGSFRFFYILIPLLRSSTLHLL